MEDDNIDMNNTSYVVEQTECDLIGVQQEEPAHVEVNIYESEEEENEQRNTIESSSPRSPALNQYRTDAKFFADSERENLNNSNNDTIESDIELQKIGKGSASSQKQPLLKSASSNGEKETSNMNLYQLEERYFHFKRTSAQYEKLYVEYLEKYILASKDKQIMIYKQRNVNFLIGKTAWIMAIWDSMEVKQKKIALASGGLCMLLFIVFIIF